jgi:hypothetical protein
LKGKGHEIKGILRLRMKMFVSILSGRPRIGEGIRQLKKLLIRNRK